MPRFSGEGRAWGRLNFVVVVGTVAVVVCVRSTGPSLCLRREGTRECLAKLAG